MGYVFTEPSQDHLKITGDFNCPVILTMICQRNTAHLCLIFRGYNHLGTSCNVTIFTRELNSIWCIGYLIVLTRIPTRMVCRGPYITGIQVLDIKIHPPGILCHIFSPAGEANLLIATKPCPGIRQHDRILSIRNTMCDGDRTLGGVQKNELVLFQIDALNLAFFCYMLTY